MQTISGVRTFSYDSVLAGEMRRYGRAKRQRKNFCRLFSSDSQLLPFWLGHPYLVLARLRPFAPLSCKESQQYRLKKTDCGMYYLPYATSLRLSDFGMQ